VILFDGFGNIGSVPAPTMVDNLIAAKRIGPVNRGKELEFHEPFVEFLANELVPWMRATYGCSPEASATVVGGASLGGLASHYAALRRPDIFGNVIAMSSSLPRTRDGERSGSRASS
jgi:enterochelin esterase family protein